MPGKCISATHCGLVGSGGEEQGQRDVIVQYSMPEKMCKACPHALLRTYPYSVDNDCEDLALTTPQEPSPTASTIFASPYTGNTTAGTYSSSSFR